MKNSKWRKIGFEVWHSTLLGLFFGACFPLLGYFIFLKEGNLDFTLDNILAIHQESNLFYVIDLAPFVLGALFMVLGKFAKYQLEYLIGINDLERSMRDESYDATYKYSLRKIRVSYLYTFLISFLVLGISLVALITNFFSDSNEAVLRSKIESLYANPDWLNNETLETNIFSHQDWSDALRYPALVPEVQRINVIRNLQGDQRRQALDLAFVQMNRNTIAIQQDKSLKLLVTCGLSFLVIVTLMILMHFYVFAPNFIYLQKAINENTISKYVIQKQADELNIAKQEIQEHLDEIQSNFQVARHINELIRAKRKPLDEIFSAGFLFESPLQSLSGDFVWQIEIGHDQSILIIGDCIGHGVAGMMISNLYEQVLQQICTQTTDPGQIIRLVDQRIRAFLNVSNGLDELTCDMAVLHIDQRNLEISYAGAYIDLLHISQSVNTIKSERFSLGSLKYKPQPQVHKVKVQSNDWVVLYSDGFKNLLNKSNQRLGAANANEEIKNLIDKYTIDKNVSVINGLEELIQQSIPNDDITIIGLKF